MTAPSEPENGWRKAAASNSSSGNCVELAKLADGRIAVRDSKDPNGPRLIFTVTEWAAFDEGLRNGEFMFLLEE